jgi:hypothetical protein
VGGGAAGPSPRHAVVASLVAVVLVKVGGQGGFPGAAARPLPLSVGVLLLQQPGFCEGG